MKKIEKNKIKSNLSILIAAFFVCFALFASPNLTYAASRSDCNNKSDSDKCKKDIDRRCGNITVPDRKDDCIKSVLRDYSNANESKESIGTTGQHQCGNMPNAADNVKTVFDFGCLGAKGPKNLSPIKDFAYAIIRFLSIGVGIAIVLSIIYAGIQYSSSMGNPEATGKAKNRIQQTMIGFFIYIFAFSILQYLIPGGIFK